MLKDRLFSLGYDINTSDDYPVKDCSWVIFMDSPDISSYYSGFKGKLRWLKSKLKKGKNESRNIYQECIEQRMENKIALFLWEGKSVKPNNYTQAAYNKFPIIFTWNDALVDNKKFFKFFLPCPIRGIIDPPVPFEKKKLIVNMSANKFSSFPGELYSERRKTIKFFEKKYPNDIDLYGPKWNKPASTLQSYFPFLVEKFSCYQGISENKMETLSNYKFSLCYENLEGERGYITEKVFDCMHAGCVPIYWGADNVMDYIDKNTFIDRRKFNTDQELADYLINMNEDDYSKYLEAMKNYLATDRYKLFLSENFVNTIIKVLHL
jgi:alpha(1,3/1,4) fucosyltransferase